MELTTEIFLCNFAEYDRTRIALQFAGQHIYLTFHDCFGAEFNITHDGGDIAQHDAVDHDIAHHRDEVTFDFFARSDVDIVGDFNPILRFILGDADRIVRRIRRRTDRP